MSDPEYIAIEGDLTAVFYYDVGELYVRSDDLGTTVEAERDGLSVRLVFPGADQSFPGPPRSPSTNPIRGSRGAEGDPRFRNIVTLVQLRVDLGRGLGDEGPGEAESTLLRKAEPIASAVVRSLLDWARTRDRQAWLSPPHIVPEVVGAAYLVNESGQSSRGHGTTSMVMVVHGEKDENLPSGDMRESLTLVEVPEAESLLAEARWAIWPTRDPDTKRAVLLAAIALEVKAPQVLLARADETSRNLLRVLFDRHDETGMSVYFLLNDVAEAILGESLKAHDGHLAKSVRLLYAVRNEVAHSGRTPDMSQAHRVVQAAERAFKWLDASLSA